MPAPDKLNAGKLREAEASLESALASQDQRLQPAHSTTLDLSGSGRGLKN